METSEHKGKQFDIKWSRDSSHTADFYHLYMPHSPMWIVKARKIKKAGHVSQTGTEVNFVGRVLWECDNMDDPYTDRRVKY